MDVPFAQKHMCNEMDTTALLPTSENPQDMSSDAEPPANGKATDGVTVDGGGIVDNLR
jgi:hypothetical protein